MSDQTASVKIESSPATLGAVVSDVTLAELADDHPAVADIRNLLDERGVVAFPGQHLDDEGLENVASWWAPPQPHPVVEFLGGNDVIGVVFNDVDHPPAEGGDSSFHTDYSFDSHIPSIAVLTSVTAPSVGGATTWSDAVGAFGALASPTAARVGSLTALHDPGPRFRLEMEVRMGAEIADSVAERFGSGHEHPIVGHHPRTGEPLLFVNPGYTRRVVGLEDDESSELLAELFAAFVEPSRQFTHQWTEGDVVIWDEHRTVHRGPNDFGTATRELHRCTAGRIRPT